jgi:hypothetical protein
MRMVEVPNILAVGVHVAVKMLEERFAARCGCFHDCVVVCHPSQQPVSLPLKAHQTPTKIRVDKRKQQTGGTSATQAQKCRGYVRPTTPYSHRGQSHTLPAANPRVAKPREGMSYTNQIRE